MIRESALGSTVGIGLRWPEGGYKLKEQKKPLGGLACRHTRPPACFSLVLSCDDFRVKCQCAHKKYLDHDFT